MNDQPSPLLEAQEDSLAKLFSADPLHLQDRDIDQIIEKMREHRQAWKNAEMAGKTRVPKAKEAKQAFDLDSLEI